MFIVIFGGVLSGFSFEGPFATEEEAKAYAECDGCVAPLKEAYRVATNVDGKRVVSLRMTDLGAPK